ncbi:hypothetical protein ART_3410 [Arthrobacter sp. PAMC 25486]|nr:hypothetical protein ART_3410 [Arthrobacter sp. PAMC 25486]
MPAGVLEQIGENPAVEYVRRYFAVQANGRPVFTGSKFETFAGGGDVVDPHRITSNDLVAVSMLSVDVPGQAAYGIVEVLVDEITGLLEQLPVGVQLSDLSEHGFERLLDAGSPADQLWKVLRQHEDKWKVGQTTASKILARKRPHLIPVYDTVVAAQAGLADSGGQWRRWWEAFQGSDGQELTHRLVVIRAASGQQHLSLLRVLDVVLWMNGARGQQDAGRSE